MAHSVHTLDWHLCWQRVEYRAMKQLCWLVGSIGCAAVLTVLCAERTSAATTAVVVTPYASKAPLRLGTVTISATTVPRYGKIEFQVNLAATFDNPFDPEDIALEARVTPPSHPELSVPGFFHRDFERKLVNGRENLSPLGTPAWRLRFAPTETGEYAVVLVARDRSGQVQSAPVTFAVTNSPAPGFVRVSQKDRRYFAWDSGESFFPVGANVCWGGGRGSFDYDEWFPRFAGAGCNYARLWLSPHWTTFALERPGRAAEGHGLGQYDLANAWRLDRVLELAAQHGLWLMLCIDSYNILREKDGYPEWLNTPHNAANGGPLQRPTDFWTDPVMEKLYRAKLRYLVARYGWSPNVLSWEFWNEVDITTGYRSGPARAWHERMAATLRGMDPWQHLITTSFANTPGDRQVDSLPGLDYVQTHHYDSPDLAVTLARAQSQKAAYGKPHMVGEIGADSGGPRSNDDPRGYQIHDPIWVSLATGGSGTASPWWWDNCIAPRNLYSLWKPVTEFIRGVDWPAEGFQPANARVAWQQKPNPLPRRDLELKDAPVSWDKTEFNRPRRVQVTAAGVQGQLPLAGIQHGLGGHRDKHNPATFEFDLPWPSRCEVEVSDVSGWGGAALKMTLDGQTALFKDFPDPDGATNTATLRQFAGRYGVEVPAGKHTVVVENTGADWFQCHYWLRQALEQTGPPVLAWAIAGRHTGLAWARVEARDWRHLCALKEKSQPVPASVLVWPGLAIGRWEAEIWDTWKGEVVGRTTVEVGGDGEGRIPMPEMEHDWAIKLLRQ